MLPELETAIAAYNGTMLSYMEAVEISHLYYQLEVDGEPLYTGDCWTILDHVKQMNRENGI